MTELQKAKSAFSNVIYRYQEKPYSLGEYFFDLVEAHADVVAAEVGALRAQGIDPYAAMFFLRRTREQT